MAQARSVLREGFTRLPDLVHGAVEGLSVDELALRLDAESNSIGWLVWHLTRVQDDHIAGVASSEQVWTAGGWFERFGLPFDPSAHGYGQSAEDVAAVRVEAALLSGYFDAVYAQSLNFIDSLADADFDRVVDPRFDPPVTLEVRLVSVLSDDLQHAGQAAFIRGIVLRRR
jgi:hypothetical protein